MTDLLDKEIDQSTTSVECFGLNFPSEAARREHFLRLLQEKLEDPSFRGQPGFPEGSNEAILEMSDPPYYTACPNPWLDDYSSHFGKPYNPSQEYEREPMAVNVSVGKSDPIYQAHAYHTKVPHLAIVPSILHFTEPGDIVLDGFAGSGMTGVAAQWCGAAPPPFRRQVELEWKKAGIGKPKWGARRTILSDLSPAATFISGNQNLPFDAAEFGVAARQLLKDVETEIGWMYETLHSDKLTKGRIEYTVWSEIFSCPECTAEVNFAEHAFDEDQRVKNTFACPQCGADLNKKKLERMFETRADPAQSHTWQRVKFEPVLICYSVGKKRFEKKPDDRDLSTLRKIEEMPFPSGLPTDRFPIEEMYHGSRIAPKGFTNVHHFFLPRVGHALALMWRLAESYADARLRHALLYFVEQAIWTSSVLNRFQPQGFKQVNKYLPGVYYIPSKHCEVSPWYAIGSRGGRLTKTFSSFRPKLGDAIISTGTAERISAPDSCVDYIFTDPPSVKIYSMQISITW